MIPHRSGKKAGREVFDQLGGLINEFMAGRSLGPAGGGRYLVRRVLEGLGLDGARAAGTILELGAGTGELTRPILSRLRPGARLLAIERDEEPYGVLSRVSDARLTAVHGDARRLPEILASRGVTRVEAIVSGIQFFKLRPRAMHELLSLSETLLTPGGRFVAYQTSTHLIPVLSEYFPRVKTAFEVRNLPPLFVFTAVK